MPEQLAAISARLPKDWLESLALYACRLDRNGAILSCNARVCELLGKDREELIGTLLASHAADCQNRPLLEAAFARPRHRGGISTEFADCVFEAPDVSKRRYVRWFLSSFGENEEEGRVALGWDDTEQVQMERFILRLARVVDLTEESVVIANSKGVVEWVNACFTVSSGYSPADVIGRSLGGIVSLPEDMGAVQKALVGFERGEPWQGRLHLRKKSGDSLSLHCRVAPAKDPAGRTTHYIAIGTDISRQRDLERQVEELQRLEAVGTLANGLTHRFNNILAAISGQTELLLMSPVIDPLVRKRAEKILEATRKGKEAVEQLSGFTRKTDIKSRPADLVPVVRNALSFIRSVQPRIVTIRESFPEASANVMANTDEIHQVLINLLTNSLEAVKEQGSLITVSLSETSRRINGVGEPQHCIVIEVVDDGCGIPKEVQHRIFEPFFTTRGLARSTGMGLSISHGIISRHGGCINFKSDLGKGARFEVVIPTIHEKPSSALSTSSSGRNILLVDVSPYSLESGKRILQELNYQVTACADPLLAKTQLEAPDVKVDLLITDLHLGDFNGLELVAAARKARPNMPILVSVALRDDLDIDALKAMGVSDLLRKPAPVDQLVNLVDELLQAH